MEGRERPAFSLLEVATINERRTNMEIYPEFYSNGSVCVKFYTIRAALHSLTLSDHQNRADLIEIFKKIKRILLHFFCGHPIRCKFGRGQPLADSRASDSFLIMCAL